MPITKATKRFLSLLCMALLAGIIVVTSLHLYIHTLPTTEANFWLIRMFDLDSEKNVPTWYAAVLWFLVALSALVSFFSERLWKSLNTNSKSPRFTFFWLVIALAFVVASVDEVATIHEEVGSHLQDWHSASALGRVVSTMQSIQASPSSPWILYYGPILLIFGIIAITFLVRRFRHQRLLAVMCFLCANCFALAIGADHFQGMAWAKRQDIALALNLTGTTATNISITVEETLENLGCMFLILAFAGYAHHVFLLCLGKMTGNAAESPAPQTEAPTASAQEATEQHS